MAKDPTNKKNPTTAKEPSIQFLDAMMSSKSLQSEENVAQTCSKGATAVIKGIYYEIYYGIHDDQVEAVSNHGK